MSIPDYEFRIGLPAMFLQCASCEGWTQQALPTFDTLSKYYPKTYFNRISSLGRIRGVLQKFQVSGMLKKLDLALLNYCMADCKSPRILDYGSGDGTFISVAQNLRPQWYSDDFDPLKSHYGSKESTDQNSSKLGDSNYHLIRMHHVIEHIPLDSLDVDLKRIFLALKPGGLLVGETPNASSVERTLFSKYWAGFHSPRHTVVFSELALKNKLVSVGFEIVKIKQSAHLVQAAISLASVLRLPQPRFAALALIPLTLPIILLDRMLKRGAVLSFIVRRPIQ